MLITICYSILTWIQSRHRQEIANWLDEFCSIANEKESASSSLLLIREKLVSHCLITKASTSTSVECESENSESESHQEITNNYYCDTHSSVSSKKVAKKSLVSPCIIRHSNSVTRTRLIWEDGESQIQILVLCPIQIVELHDWTAFIGTRIEDKTITQVYEELPDPKTKPQKCYVLIEAEPGATRDKTLFKKFGQFGDVTAWKWGDELGLILHSDFKQLVELMHIFRQGQIILEGGWRIYRLTTVACEGTIGTLISRNQIDSRKFSLSPGDLRRLSAGIYEFGESTPSTSANETPSKSLSHDISKHDITKISEETLTDGCGAEAEDQVEISKLPNWYERSPKKRSLANIHYSEKPLIARRKGSFSSSISNLSQRSSSLASLLLCSRSISVDDSEHQRTSSTVSPAQTPDKEYKLFRPKSRQQSYESLVTPEHNLGSPTAGTTIQSYLKGKAMSLSSSLTSSPFKCATGLNVTRTPTPSRLGKPPNVLILCDNEKMRGDLASILKRMLANDRYAIYDIRWDQLVVGGWADQTALLVISGKITNPDNTGLLLQFLGDGGRLLAWCCESAPFGLPVDTSSQDLKQLDKKVVKYGTSQTQPLSLTGSNWGLAENNSLPLKFQRVLETNDSEGYSRPLTASVLAKVKQTDEAVIMYLDGGALGGKAILSQIHFEATMEDESSLSLLSLLLGQNLGMDCTRIKTPDYSIGYLLGDHKIINNFLLETPSTLKQKDLSLEFIPRGEKGPTASHSLFPIHSMECPANFSTVDYFTNLQTKDLGRLVVYSDVLTSTMDVVNGDFLRHGLVVIARQQTASKGRGKNIWLSPEGCAVFTFQLSLNLNAGPGRRITLLQHLAALAIILAVPNHKEINLRVKWPNDVYLNDQKIGGIIVESRLEGKNCNVNIGIGVNVSNSYPTVCLNSTLAESEKLSSESFIAKTLTQMEILLDILDTCPIEKILTLYADNWIHNLEDEVNVEISEGKFAQCRLNGIDEFGYLRVTEVNSGHVFSVRPDGNSFDIANRLIAIKN